MILYEICCYNNVQYCYKIIKVCHKKLKTLYTRYNTSNTIETSRMISLIYYNHNIILQNENNLIYCTCYKMPDKVID